MVVMLEEELGKRKEVKKEISRRFGWQNIPRDGGGDIDLADYPLNYQRKKPISYDNLP